MQKRIFDNHETLDQKLNRLIDEMRDIYYNLTRKQYKPISIYNGKLEIGNMLSRRWNAGKLAMSFEDVKALRAWIYELNDNELQRAIDTFEGEILSAA